MPVMCQLLTKAFIQLGPDLSNPSNLPLSHQSTLWKKTKTYTNRLDQGQPPSNLAAGLISNLFATQTTIPHQNFKPIFKVLNSRRRLGLFLEYIPAYIWLIEVATNTDSIV